jgi:hypothetical protein
MSARTSTRTLSLVAALATLLTAMLVAIPAEAAGIGERCVSFRGANRCAHWASGVGSNDNLYARTTINVRNGDHAEVRVALLQRRTKSGWVTWARGGGSGVRGSYAASSATAGTCGDLKKGTYRSRGKVRWTSEGVRYTRWITGRAVKKSALC